MSQHDLSQAAPSDWVLRWADAIPATGRILDLACGGGRHLRALSARKQSLLGIDLNIGGASKLATLSNVELRTLDLEQPGAELPAELFAGIIVTNYLHRPLLTRLPALLAPGGVLIYETFAEGNAAFGRPKNPDYLLKPGELRTAYADILELLGFEEGYVAVPRPAVIQRYCGRVPFPT